MSELSYFDVRCAEYGFNRKYLHYLHPVNLQLVLICCKSKLTKKMICDEFNKLDKIREFTPSRLEKRLSDIRIKLYELHRYAELFDVSNKIEPKSLEELNKIAKG